tara:strand:- start:7672 stop:7971 length:300 start_codon:yes stop_codon:yes gene_type:complete
VSSTYNQVCPACRSKLRIRTSEGQTACFRTVYYECTNLICGAKFSGTQSIDYQLSPSGLEQPLIQLPVAPHMERMRALRFSQPAADQADLFDTEENTNA